MTMVYGRIKFPADDAGADAVSEKCENCRHYVPVEKNGGVCRRYSDDAAGHLILLSESFIWFPGTYGNYWCGEYEPRETDEMDSAQP